MQLNSRAVLWTGAVVVVALVVAAFLLPIVYVALAVAVLLLVALVVANRMRVAREASLEADGDEATSRLAELAGDDDGDLDEGEHYDASAFDAILYGSEPRTPEADVERSYADAAPAADDAWSTNDFASTPSFVDEEPSAEAAYETVEYEAYEYETYEPAVSGDGDRFTDPAVAFESYTGPSRTDAFTPAYDDPSMFDEPLIDESIIERVDATSVLADEGVIDESKVTSTESILAASQATRLAPEQMTEEEQNAETREILGRVAALLAKYE